MMKTPQKSSIFLSIRPFSTYDMANGAFPNFNTMKTRMVFIKAPLHNGIVPLPLLFPRLLAIPKTPT